MSYRTHDRTCAARCLADARRHRAAGRRLAMRIAALWYRVFSGQISYSDDRIEEAYAALSYGGVR